jgi:amidophosphoribosyltransferase
MSDDTLREACGIFGIYDHEDAARLTYYGLYALQHRGQESAGIATSDGERLHVVRGLGYVSDVFREETFAELPGRLAIGHVRYSTTGEVSVREAQPIAVSFHGGEIAVCHNGNMPHALRVRAELEREGAIFQSTSDTEVVLHLIARAHARDLVGAIVEALLRLGGAYSMLFATPRALIAARDPRGFRPLLLGVLDGATVFASESCALDLIGATLVRDVEPGEVIVVDERGMRSFFPFPPERPAQCIFEHVYFSRPDSIVFGRPVSRSRYLLGRLLAREHPASADVVVPVPDSGVAAAIGYSMESGIPLVFGLVRNHYVGRTFIEPRAAIRNLRVKVKLNPVRELIEGRSLVLVDDSIVRGTTSREIVQMIRAAGAREIHVRISCPPTIAPCYYGIDTPRTGELIAAQMSIEEIRRFLGADSLGYLSYASLLEACGDPEDTRYCTACYTGRYPTEIVPDYEPRSVRCTEQRAKASLTVTSERS